MESLGELLEQELEEAVEVKNKKSLHRYITLLTEGLTLRERNEREHSEFREAVIRIDTRIEEGFKRMDERFESVNKRFSMMFTFITIGFVALATLMSVFQFLG